MANKIQFKRGPGAPAPDILDLGEPGFDTTNNKFYIGDSEGNPILINEEAEVYAADESVEVSAEVIDAGTLGGHPASDFRSSTWLPTPSEIGAASTSSGYGSTAINLGSFENEEDLTTAIEAVYVNMSNSETKMIRFQSYPSTSDYNFYGVLAKSSANYGSLHVQTAFSRGTMLLKTKFAGVWQPLEWENPPMKLDVEYRTTERWDDKPVYAKRISYTPTEAITASTTVQTINIPHNISGITNLVRWSGRTNANGYVFPYLSTSGGLTTIVGFGNSALVLRTVNTSWATSYTFYFDMYYTKT